jgi:TrpR-related protein YerC/YecD
MPQTKPNSERAVDELCDALLRLKSRKELKAFFEDLLTPAEMKAVSERWSVVLKLEEGISYRRIYEETGVSTATVTRVARCLSAGAGGYARALERLGRRR